MTDHQSACRQIISYFYECEDLPEDIRQILADWLLSHAEDEAVTEAMSGLWQKCEEDTDRVFDGPGLQRLLSEVNMTALKSGRRRRLLWYAAASVIALAALAAAYTAGTCTAPTDTVLLAAKGSKGEFMLPDSSRVWLNGGSTLRYSTADFTADSRNVKIDGEAYLEVKKDAGRPFTVELSDMNVEVLGTSFDVRDYSFSSSQEVVLSEGSVKVTSPHIKEPLIMKPDQRLVIDRRTGATTLSATRARNYCTWHKPCLRFEGETLGDILIQLGRRYSLDLEVAPGVDTSIHISLTIYNDDISEVLKVISYLTSIHYSIENNTLKVST